MGTLSSLASHSLSAAQGNYNNYNYAQENSINILFLNDEITKNVVDDINATMNNAIKGGLIHFTCR